MFLLCSVSFFESQQIVRRRILFLKVISTDVSAGNNSGVFKSQTNARVPLNCGDTLPGSRGKPVGLQLALYNHPSYFEADVKGNEECCKSSHQWEAGNIDQCDWTSVCTRRILCQMLLQLPSVPAS